MSKPTDIHPWVNDDFSRNATKVRQLTIDDQECVLTQDIDDNDRDIHGLKTRNTAALKLYEELQERRRLEEENNDPLFNDLPHQY